MRFHVRFHVHAALTALLTFLLMAIGSLVHGTGSSLACPDWPLCHGEVFPAMRGGVEYEHTHRLVALAVVVSTIALAIRARKHERAVRALAWLAVLLLFVQAALGGATVILRLPMIISVAHLTTSMTLLAMLVAIAARAWPARAAQSYDDAGARTLLTLALASALAQVVLGAIVRHSGAALACTDLPWCDELWPEARLAQLHALHRGGAIVVAALVVIACVRVARRAPHLAGVAFMPVACIAAQAALGVAVVTGGASLAAVTMHHAMGALLVASLALLTSASAASSREDRRT
jgi:heme A synthase